MKGYKAFYKKSDGTLFTNGMSRGLVFEFEVGKTYKIDGKIEICSRGYHFCEDLYYAINNYPMGSDIAYCEIEASGDIKHSGDKVKSVCSEITIIKELDRDEIDNMLMSEYADCIDINSSVYASCDSRFCFGSIALYKSFRVRNSRTVDSSNGVSDSKAIINGNNIDTSIGVYQSDYISHSYNAYNSEYNIDVINSYNSRLSIDSENVDNSKEVIHSKNVYHSFYIKESSNIESSFLILGSKNIINSLALRKCYNVSNSLFCYDISNKEYYIFNKKVKRERFLEVMESFSQIYYIQMTMIEYDKKCRAILNYKPEWASTIRDIFFDITFRLEEFDLELLENILTVPSGYLKDKYERWQNENKGL